MLYSQSPPLADDDAVRDDPPHQPVRDREARAEPRFGRRPEAAPAYSAPPRPSLGRRMVRAIFRFAMAVAIGVGATLGWQAYGDMAKQMLAELAPEHAWLLSYLPATRPPAAVAAARSPALQLEPLTSSLEVVRRSVEQLAAKQEQMARNIVALQAIEEDIRQKVSSPPPVVAQPPAQPAAQLLPPKPPSPKPQPPAATPSSAPRPSASAPLPISPPR